MHKKLIAISLAAGAGSLIGSGMLLSANAAGVSATPCETAANQPAIPAGSQTVPIPSNPTGSGTAYAGGSPTSGGAVGAQGTQGWIQAGGGTSGGQIAGYSSQPNGPNGYLNVGTSPSLCIGAGGQYVSAP